MTSNTRSVASSRVDLALLILRVGLGVVFVMHGWQKAFEFGPAGLTQFFAGIGIPFAGANAIFITGLELFGGVAILAGALTRVIAPLLSATMVVAILTVHLANGFFAGANGYEFPLTLLFISAALTVTGAGRYSVDSRFAAQPADGVEPRRRLDVAA
jgi:putative oxidoreductase